MKGIFRFDAVDGPEMEATREIPFVPHNGDMLAVTKEGDFFRVDDVYWHCDRPEEVTVWLALEDDVVDSKYLQGQGWKRGG